MHGFEAKLWWYLVVANFKKYTGYRYLNNSKYLKILQKQFENMKNINFQENEKSIKLYLYLISKTVLQIV